MLIAKKPHAEGQLPGNNLSIFSRGDVRVKGNAASKCLRLETFQKVLN
jgi:hypothetical protein